MAITPEIDVASCRVVLGSWEPLIGLNQHDAKSEKIAHFCFEIYVVLEKHNFRF